MVEAAIVEPAREEVHRGQRRCELRASPARWRRTLSVRAGLTRREVFFSQRSDVTIPQPVRLDAHLLDDLSGGRLRVSSSSNLEAEPHN